LPAVVGRIRPFGEEGTSGFSVDFVAICNHNGATLPKSL